METNDTVKTIAKRLKDKRKEIGLTLDDVAESLGISSVTLHKYENLGILNIPAEKIERLAKLYNTDPAYIMGWTEEKIEDEILEKDDSEQEKEINLLNNMLNMLRDYNYKINIINQGSKDEYYQLINTKDRFLKIKKDDLINICLSTKKIFVDLLKNYSKNFNEKGKWE